MAARRPRSPDALSAFTRVFNALWQHVALAAWCAADPGSIRAGGSRLCGAPQERCAASGTRLMRQRPPTERPTRLRRRASGGILPIWSWPGA